MLKVGITGGIGSGKTVVCRLFEVLGVPVFYADTAARELTDTNPDLIAAIKEIFGEDIYTLAGLDRKKAGRIAFADPDKLQQLNKVIHPATLKYAKEWMEIQTTPYAIKEAAIFFESATHKDMDLIIGVSAPMETRITRVMLRNEINREEVMMRISRQMDETEKMSLCDYIVLNDDKQALIPQVVALHQMLITR